MKMFKDDGVVRVDARNCTCGDCARGVSVALSKVNTKQTISLLLGELENNTGCNSVEEVLEAVSSNSWVYDYVSEWVEKYYGVREEVFTNQW